MKLPIKSIRHSAGKFIIPASTALFLLSSCDDKNDGPLIPAPDENMTRYEFSMRDSQGSISTSLHGIRQAVTSVDSPFGWLTISQDGNDESGDTRISIVRTAPTPAGFSADSAYINLADNSRVKLVITAEGPIIPLDENSGEYDRFNKAWWEQEEILYSTTRTINGKIETTSQHIPLPWAPAATSNIPTHIFEADGLTANVGWTMAYNLFAAQTNGNPNSKPYFMLYNRYTGAMRVFYYQFENAGTGGELSFVVTPDAATSPKYPYYHSLQYAIPVCNKDVPLKGNVFHVTKGTGTFQQQVTPYLKSDVALKTGWYCFDIDWSAYNPAATTLFKGTDRMSIDCKTANNTTITMSGAITGNSEGTIESLSQSSTSTANGMNYLDQTNSASDDASEALSSFMKGDYLKALYKGAMSLWNYGKAVNGEATDDYTTETKSTGTINQSFTGKISLDGYSTSDTSNNAIGVEFSYNAFSGGSYVGAGVWSLQDNPTVYVVDDCLMGEDEDLVFTVAESDYLMGAEDPAPNNLRLMTFFDPTSIKINLNTSVFNNISNVTMSWTYGVYPNQPKGHTDVYRFDLLDYKSRDMFDMPQLLDKSKHKGAVYKSFASDFDELSYLEYPVEDLTMTSVDNSTKATFYTQKDALYRYYAHPGNNKKADDKDFFIVDPIVFLPTDCIKKDKDDQYGVGKLYDFEAPDFVVGVVLSFDYTLPDGTKARAILSKRFIPQVKAISTSDMLKKKASLDTYVKNGVHQTVNNVKIKHNKAKEMLKQFFSTAEYIKDNKD